MTYDIPSNLKKFTCLHKYGVHFLWYPPKFSQSRLGNKKTKGSNACTIIALLMAKNVHKSSVRLKCMFTSPTQDVLAKLFSDAIRKGNAIHQDLFKNCSDDDQDTNLTVPEAMNAAKSCLGTLTEWKSFVYRNEMTANLYAEMQRNVKDWQASPACCHANHLYMILIAHNKAVLFVMQFDANCVLLVDSHQHLPYGALMSQTRLTNLENLCLWYSHMLCNAVGSQPIAYELSFLYYKCEKRNDKTFSR
ncbi:uncharacterized protein LOC112682957 [Sipha flava]|uniref:Uncharacterized protein LOC112682957 n=1 Tax=Sipha flava TaxID=143950 RepID=A0A8B8FG95_9HEMI|nr:uncharacterized protein LOC112682957 [Sipha flava]